jgi:hypothetical protein
MKKELIFVLLAGFLIQSAMAATTNNISGFKLDQNGTGLPGFTMTLSNDTPSFNMSTTTGNDGSYIFSGLSNGTYNITETELLGWTPVNPSSGSLSATVNGSDVSDMNFTNTQVPVTSGGTFSISGFKLDQNGTGVSGFTMTLTNDTTSFNMSTTTGNDGSYSFSGLSNGTYNITETPLSGWTPVNPSSGILSATVEGSDVSDMNFTNTQVSVTSGEAFSISGFKLDENGSGISGFTITLTNDTPEFNMSTTTGNDGSYTFSGLSNGTYNITETPLPGWAPVNPSSGSLSATVDGSDVSDMNFTNTQVPVTSGGTFSISGFKLDQNGTGVSGFTITLTNDTSSFNMSTTTGDDGSYSFSGLSNGTYNVTETPLSGWTPVNPSSGSLSVVISGADMADQNFTNSGPSVPVVPTGGTIKGEVYKSWDKDQGLSGFDVVLVGIGKNTKGIHMKATTDDNGFYSFTGLAKGSYKVHVRHKSGWIPKSEKTVTVRHLRSGKTVEVNFAEAPIRNRENKDENGKDKGG